MLNIEEISLIEPYDETPPRRCLFTLVRQGQRLEAPIAQPTGTHIVLLTLLLGAIATPLCLFIYSALRPSDPSVGIGLLLGGFGYLESWDQRLFGCLFQSAGSVLITGFALIATRVFSRFAVDTRSLSVMKLWRSYR